MALFFICSGALSPNHEWNMVYVDGRWWDVDVTANDCGDDTEYRKDWTILRDPAEEELAGTHDCLRSGTAGAGDQQMKVKY